MVTDPIADLLTRIRNANMAFRATVEVPYSKFKWAVVNILKADGFIEDCTLGAHEDHAFKVITLKLKYAGRKERVISGLERISKPGRRVYAGAKDLKKYQKGFGVTIVSTPKGVKTHIQAYREKVGGEVLCVVW